MCAGSAKTFLREVFRLGFGVFAVVSFLMRPAVAAQGVLQGLALCYNSVIPALFPFFVLSKLILTSPLASWLSLPLLPYTRYVLGIRDRRAATALLLGLTGGFGGGAACLQTLYSAHALTRVDANRLLWCLINAGPAFVAAGVGASMLGSAAAGWLLYAALCCASLCSGALGRILSPGARGAQNAQDAEEPAALVPPLSLTDCVREAVSSVLNLCGFVLFFSFFIAVLVPPNAAFLARFALCVPLEVTAACSFAAESDNAFKLYLCCAALSVMGASIFLQVRSLVPSALSLRPLLVSRMVHLPLSLGFSWLFLRLFPVALETAAQPLLRLRMPLDACFAVFLLCCTFFCVATKDTRLRFSQKKV